AASPTTQTAPEQLFNLLFPAGNTSEDYLNILHSVRFNTASAYMRVSNPVNSSKLSLIEKGICEDIQCKNEELVIEKQGLYLIYCHLNFYFSNCSNNPTDLKIELLVNDTINRQTLSTWCASDTCQEKSFKTLFLLHLTHLNTKDRISVRLNQPEFLNVVFLPNENVLGVLRYSDKM
ncbi:TNFL8 factor, partial [Crypturellus undulatus]|nr:TNFL8 factor [Crypturellus undulatus]